MEEKTRLKIQCILHALMLVIQTLIIQRSPETMETGITQAGMEIPNGLLCQRIFLTICVAVTIMPSDPLVLIFLAGMPAIEMPFS